MASVIKLIFPGLLDSHLVQLELALVLASVVAGLAGFRFAFVERLLRRWSRHPARAFVACAVGTLALHALVAQGMVRHEPEVHDEFSYLLAADTFLHGAMSNPPHPLWRSFETAHVLFQPRYASMYPPGQGLLLAAGKKICGDYLAGPWLAAALLAGLAGWMLAGWVPAHWALLGAILVALRIGVFSYWANSYWGGALPAIGGVLLFGSLPRLLKHPGIRDAALMALGLVTLALTRPYEGVLVCVAAAVAAWAERKRVSWNWRQALPALCVALAILAAGGAFLLYYNWRVTGSPLTMGHQLSMQRYGLAVFPWQSTHPASPPQNANLLDFYDAQHQWLEGYKTLGGFLYIRSFDFGVLWAFFLGPLLSLPFVTAPVLLQSRRWRWILLGCAAYAVGLALTPFFFAHYAAPGLGLMLLCLIQAMRVTCAAKSGNGRPLAGAMRVVPVICVAVFACRAAIPALQFAPAPSRYAQPWYNTGPGNRDRAAVLAMLERLPGRHIVLVQYQPGHLSSDEWVYNEARIDDSKVVWAHDLDAQSNARLVAYYRDRAVWRINPDTAPRQPVRVTESEFPGR